MSEPAPKPTADAASPEAKKMVAAAAMLVAAAAVIVGTLALVLVMVAAVSLTLLLATPEQTGAKVSNHGANSFLRPVAHDDEPLQPSNDSFLVITESSGNKTAAVSSVDGVDLPMAISITHDGSGPFSVMTLDANGVEGELLVDTVGTYSGTLIANIYRDKPPVSLRILADGNWSFTVRTIGELPEFTSQSTWGVGDMVLIYNGDATTADFTHDGSGPFSVWTYGDQPTQLINEQGASYAGPEHLRAGPELISIRADGEWSIALR